MSGQKICPRFIIWRRVFAILDEAWRKNGSQEPPPPNVYNFQGWSKSNDQKKQELWKKTLSWAEDNGFSDLIPDLYEADMFYGDKDE